MSDRMDKIKKSMTHEQEPTASSTKQSMDHQFYASYTPNVEKRILYYLGEGMTVREAIEEVRPHPNLRDQLIEKFERLWCRR